MLLVQEFLKSHSFKNLQEAHGVYASFSKSGHKFSLNYDQIDAKNSDPLSQQCRGLILAAKDGKSFLSQAVEINNRLNYDHIIPGDTCIVAYPMNRFFNYSQDVGLDLNWSDPKLAIFEKLDGTLTILYNDPFINKWCVATRAVPEADVPLDGGFYTFRMLFEKALKDTNGMSFEKFTDLLDKEITYCFELTSPYNRIIVDYKECRLTLIAARQITYGHCGDKSTWECFNELDIDNVPTYGVPHVRTYAFVGLNGILDLVSDQNPLEHEGVVVRDSQFNRIKIKNASYVAFNRARDILGTSERNCLELVLSGKEDDVIPALPPEIVERITFLKQGVSIMIKEHDNLYTTVKSTLDTSDKKTFALAVTKLNIWTAPMFTIFDGKACDMKDFIAKNRKEGTWANNFLDKILSIIHVNKQIL
jgi:hypothetical protein